MSTVKDYIKKSRVIQSDSLDFMKTIESNSIDLIITSPPYNVGKEIYSQRDINKEFNTQFNQKGWKSHEIKYFFTPDEAVARETIGMTAVEQKSELLKVGRKAFSGKNQTDFLKDNIAIEVQFGKYAYVAYDLFVKHMAFYIANDMNVGIEILPTKALQLKMDTGVPCYEKEVYIVYIDQGGIPLQYH
ncbi:BglII/BstYI family type II restriction endonuclease [Macrococcoides bohemicum]|uniref:BglII/BstYI family type II restriction endonuclease n=1 Tax=Macrococcoides bohemicum TaxID=1903056 RepID=UPI00165D836C|nr:BglII/BstYI family type II restriction endonuclease [Macrococcus bohemicus]MBC9873469.1 restriction endonuclease [Macrococcus bohemicus]